MQHLTKELKVKVDSLQGYTKTVVKRGGVFQYETVTKHIYFNQPADRVLKIVFSPDNLVRRIRLELQDNQFVFIENKLLKDAHTEIDKLADQFGIKDSIEMRARKYLLNDTSMGFYKVSNKGKFIVLESERPKISDLELLGIENPEIITVSFDQLPDLI